MAETLDIYRGIEKEQEGILPDNEALVGHQSVEQSVSVEYRDEVERRVPRDIAVGAASELVSDLRHDYDQQLEQIQGEQSGETRITNLKTFFHRSVDLFELTQDETDKGRIEQSYHAIVKALGGGARDLRMSDETCVFARLNGENDKIKEVIRILKETFADNNIESNEEYAGKYAFAIEQLARSGQYGQARREQQLLDIDLRGMGELRPHETDEAYSPGTKAEIEEARRRITDMRLYLWQHGLTAGTELPPITDTYKIYDQEQFRRLAFKIAFTAPDGIAQQAKRYIEERYYNRERDQLTVANHKVDAFVESQSIDAYYEALGAAVDVPLPAVNKAELLVKMSLEGSAAFNDMSFEERDKFAGAAQLVLDALEHELHEYGWQDRPLNKDQVEVALRRVNEKSKARKIGALLSRTFVQHARSHEQDDTYYENARHLHHKLSLEVAFVTGQPEDMSAADRSYDRYGGPRTALDGEGHIRNLEYAIRQVEILALQGDVYRALRLARVDNLADSYETAQELYIPIIAGAMLRNNELEYAERLMARLTYSQRKQLSTAGDTTRKQQLFQALADYADTPYNRRNEL